MRMSDPLGDITNAFDNFYTIPVQLNLKFKLDLYFKKVELELT